MDVEALDIKVGNDRVASLFEVVGVEHIQGKVRDLVEVFVHPPESFFPKF
ncbi:unnamed protein product, partial [marine sediment metagenome]